MTNEEKAREIAKACKREYKCYDDMSDREGCCYFVKPIKECEDSAMKMAEWKDRQFKEYLEKKNTEISNAKAKLGRDDADYLLYTLKSLFIDEIIDELFKED